MTFADNKIRTAVRDAIAAAIGENAYDCTRVWNAWNVGTMDQDDFVSIVEDEDRLMEIADAAIDAIAKQQSQGLTMAEVQDWILGCRQNPEENRWVKTVSNDHDALAIALAALHDLGPRGYSRPVPPPDAAEGPRKPDGYAYRYQHFGGSVIRFNGGGEVNGSRPVEAIPYWLGEPHQPAPAPVSEPQNERSAECVESWPDCYEGGYDPRCCRFPKSCSCTIRPSCANPTSENI